MTQNQLAYQANLIKAREAADKEMQTKIKMSEHLYEYPKLRSLAEQYVTNNWGNDIGLKQWDTLWNKNPLWNLVAVAAKSSTN